MYVEVAISPDGRSVAAVKASYPTPAEAERLSLVLIDLATGEQRTLAAEADRRPEHPVWGPDASVLYFTSDDAGHHSAYRVDLPDGRVTRLSATGSVTDLCPTPDGPGLFALRSTLATPPRVVRLDARTARPGPGRAAQRAGRAGHRGRRRRSSGWPRSPLTARRSGRGWFGPPTRLATAPAPLVVFVHGGPLGTWNSWHWRWNPTVLAARGFAVLLPDPALSTGYGQAMLDRGWGQWGGTPFTDVHGADRRRRRPRRTSTPRARR